MRRGFGYIGRSRSGHLGRSEVLRFSLVFAQNPAEVPHNRVVARHRLMETPEDDFSGYLTCESSQIGGEGGGGGPDYASLSLVARCVLLLHYD